MTKVALIACTKSKLSVAAPALHLYRSPMFRWSAAYAERWGAESVYVLSAKHGVVEGSQVLAPYDATLIGAPRQVRREWAELALEELAARHDLARDRFLLLAGEAYLGDLRSRLRQRVEPLLGLSIGRRLARLRRATITVIERACARLHL